MRKLDRERFRKVLKERLASLKRDAMEKVRAGMDRQTYDQDESGDEGDEAQRTLALDTNLVLGERDAAVARQIRAALERIQDSTFGTCVDCGQEIERERLKAVPWATRCVADQEALELEGRDITPSL